MNSNTNQPPQNIIEDREESQPSTPENNSPEIEKNLASLSRPTFKKAHSDEEFKEIPKRIANGMVKSLQEAEPD